ncbi:twitching motility protein PilT [Anaerotignum sp.]|uniref:twitching motility protein PilT n=1 Tax=Anaerotignum sp. TaxID=2039241 RepID=UPI00332B576E
MVQILAGEKGVGKTKRLITMANEASKEANGCVVFVDDDSSHMYDLHYSVRFVDTPRFIMESPQVFRGFVCGILSQNSDIEKVYIDGLNNIAEKVDKKEFVSFINDLDSISKETETDFTMIISCKGEDLPSEVQPYIVK